MFGEPILAVFLAAGVLLHHRCPNWARRLATVGGMTLLALLAGLLITGSHSLDAPPRETHRWLAHAMVVVAWIASWFSLGVLIARGRDGSWPRFACKAMLLLLPLGLVVLNSFTGYLLPRDQSSSERLVSGDTLNRFIVLHMIAVPSLIALSLVGWCNAFRRKRSDLSGSDPTAPQLVRGEQEA